MKKIFVLILLILVVMSSKTTFAYGEINKATPRITESFNYVNHLLQIKKKALNA